MPEPTLVMATRRHRRNVLEEAEPVLISVAADGYVEFVLDDGHGLDFDLRELAAALGLPVPSSRLHREAA